MVFKVNVLYNDNKCTSGFKPGFLWYIFILYYSILIFKQNETQLVDNSKKNTLPKYCV